MCKPRYFFPLKRDREEPITPWLFIEREDFPYFRDIFPKHIRDLWDFGTNEADTMLFDFGFDPETNYKLNQLWWSRYSDKRISYKLVQKWWIKMRGLILRNQEPYLRLFTIYSNLGLDLNNSVDYSRGATSYLTKSTGYNIGHVKNQQSAKQEAVNLGLNASNTATISASEHSAYGNSTVDSNNVSDNASIAYSEQSNKAMAAGMTQANTKQDSIANAKAEQLARNENTGLNKGLQTNDALTTSTDTPQNRINVPLGEFHSDYRGGGSVGSKDGTGISGNQVNNGYVSRVGRNALVGNNLTGSQAIQNGDNYSGNTKSSDATSMSNQTNNSNQANVGENASNNRTAGQTDGNTFNENSSETSQFTNTSYQTGSHNQGHTISGSLGNSLAYNDSKSTTAQDHLNQNAQASVRRVGAMEIDLFVNYKNQLGNLYDEYLDEYQGVFIPVYSTE